MTTAAASDVIVQNPRTILNYPNGRQELTELIQVRTKYVPQAEPLTLLCNSLITCLPFLSEGERGSGKTLMALSLAEACGLKTFFVPCSEATRSEELLYEWDRNAQDIYRREEVDDGRKSRDVREELWTQDFLILGKILEALDYASKSAFPPVLIVDEIDKCSHGLQGTMLEVLTAGYMTVNRLKPVGEIGMLPSMEKTQRYASYPIIIFTSNDLEGDKIIEPLRSRATLCLMKPPTGFELVKVLHSQVSSVSSELLKEMARLQKGISVQPLRSKPALREYVNFLRLLQRSGERSISAKFLYENTGFLAKMARDYEQLQDKSEMLIRSYVSLPDDEIDMWVNQSILERETAFRNVKKRTA